MKVLVFADIHTDWSSLKRTIKKEADIYIFLGDLTDLGEGLEEGAKILAPLSNKLWLLPGNNETSEQTKALSQKYGFFDFHKKIQKFGNYSLAGWGYSNPTPFKTPGEMSEDEIEKTLKQFAGQKSLLLFTHAPPKETELDKVQADLHVGSIALRKFIEKEKPISLFCGHIHETAGKIAVVGETICFNPGKEGIIINL